MSVTIEPEGSRPGFEATCSDPSADCHYICAEGCESWGEILRNEDGRVMHHLPVYAYDRADDGSPHRMEYVEECNYVGFLNNSDCVDEEMTGKPFTFVIPAEFTFEGDYVTWAAKP